MFGSTKKNVFFWINQSFGDTLGTIPIVENFLNKYPEVNITFGCWKNHSYLLKHFPIKIIEFDFNPIIGRSMRFDWYTPDDHIPIYLWLGNYPYEIGNNFYWSNCILNFNNQCRDKNIKYRLDFDLPGNINLPNIEMNIPKNSILIENGPPDTNPNHFYFDMMSIAEKFPEITFFCMGITKCTLPNIIDLSKYNLIIVQNILRRSKMFLGRGSGPCFLTSHQDCNQMIKGLFGFDYNLYGKIWDPDDTNWYYNEGNTETIIKFIEDKFKYE